MRTTDRGLQKAIKRQPHYELPSNFSYRMMQKIQEESILREKRQEKECSSSSLSSPYSAGRLHRIFIWKYGTTFISYWHTCKEILPDSHTLLFYLPTFCALCLLYFFDRWLRKKIDLEKIVYLFFHTNGYRLSTRNTLRHGHHNFFAHSIPT